MIFLCLHQLSIRLLAGAAFVVSFFSGFRRDFSVWYGGCNISCVSARNRKIFTALSGAHHEHMDIQDARARRVRRAMKIAADADHAFVRGPAFEPEDRLIETERQRFQPS